MKYYVKSLVQPPLSQCILHRIILVHNILLISMYIEGKPPAIIVSDGRQQLLDKRRERQEGGHSLVLSVISYSQKHYI